MKQSFIQFKEEIAEITFTLSNYDRDVEFEGNGNWYCITKVAKGIFNIVDNVSVVKQTDYDGLKRFLNSFQEVIML